MQFEMSAIESANAWVGALEACASSTRRMSWLRAVSLSTPFTHMWSNPSTLAVALGMWLAASVVVVQDVLVKHNAALVDVT